MQDKLLTRVLNRLFDDPATPPESRRAALAASLKRAVARGVAKVVDAAFPTNSSGNNASRG